MTTKHELVINTNEPSAPNADSFIHRILMKLLILLHISVMFSGFSGRESTYVSTEDSLMMIESQSIFKSS